MRRYQLEDLVRVRQHREEQASEAMVRARRRLKEAQDAHLQAQKDLAEYTVWRVMEERRKLDGLMQRVLKLGEISDVRAEIALLREREFEFVDRVKKAEAAVSKAEEHLQDCRAKHAQAVRELEKLLEHKTTWQREDAVETERAEEAELEDFSGPQGGSTPKDVIYERN
jgi:DNA repair exonuclease SbcCD ATPase subunit